MRSLHRPLPYLLLAFGVAVLPHSITAQNAPSGATTPPAAAPSAPAAPLTPDPARPATTQAPADLPDSPDSASQVHAPVAPTGPTAVIDTSMGRLTCKLYSKQAPVTVTNFIGLAEGTKDWTDPTTLKKEHAVRFFDGTTFHRVIPNFMIQGGDRAGNGTGDPGYFFQDEFDPALGFDVPGRLAMANSGPSTNGSQFFITEAPVPELTGKHTIFGQCDSHSVALVSSIARVPRDSNDKPETPVTIRKVTIVNEGQSMPTDPAANSMPSTTAPTTTAPPTTSSPAPNTAPPTTSSPPTPASPQ